MAKAKPQKSGAKKSAARKSAKPRPVGKEQSASGAEGGGPDKAIKLVPKTVVVDLAEKCFRLQNEVSDASGRMGKLIGEAAEKKGLHRGAFGMAKRLYLMGKKDPAKLWLLLCHFDDMRKKLDIDEMAGKQGEMFSAVEDGDDGDAETAPAQEAQPAATSAKADDDQRDLRPRFLQAGGRDTPAATTDTKLN